MPGVELDYAHWQQEGAHKLQLFDGKTGDQLFNVIEANALEGWRVELVTDPMTGLRARSPDGKHLLTKRVTGPVRIVMPAQASEEAELRKRRAAEKRARQAARQAKGMRQ